MGNQLLVFLGLLLAGDSSFVNVGVGHDDWCVIRGGEGRLQRRGRRGWAPECGGLHSLFDCLSFSQTMQRELACEVENCMLCYFGFHSDC
jgi:hypothetical protein